MLAISNLSGIVSFSIPTLIPIRNKSIAGTLKNSFLQSLPLKSQSRKHPRKLSIYSVNGNGKSNGTENGGKGSENNNGGGNGGGDSGGEKEQDLNKKKEGGGSGRPKFSLRWGDLLLDPDPDNVVAVGLTGLLTWASVQVLCQLLIISAAILVAALKYSFVAAFLLFILITLL